MVKQLAIGLVCICLAMPEPLWAQSEDSMSPPEAIGFAEAMISAYKTNPRLKAQRKALEEANEQVSQAIAGFRPSVNATYQTGRQITSFDGSPENYEDVENRTLILNQPIFLGGRNYYAVKAAKDRMKSARADLRAIEQEVLLDAVTAYMDVVQDYSLLKLSLNNVKVLKKQLKASRDRFSVGDVTRTDVAQSEARYARAQSDAIQAGSNFQGSLAQFERVIGFKPANMPLRLPERLPPLPKTLERAIERAIDDNPGIISTKYGVSAAADDVNVAVSRILPQVSLQGSINRQDGAGVLGTNRFDNDRLLLNVDIPIYQNGSEYSQVRAAELQKKRRLYELSDVRQQVREALVIAWENLEAAIATIEAQESQVRSAEIALEGVRQENQYGARTVLDVLDAEQELFIAQVELVRAQRNRYVSFFNLLQVLGELNMTNLNIDVPTYDPTAHYEDVKWQLIGF